MQLDRTIVKVGLQAWMDCMHGTHLSSLDRTDMFEPDQLFCNPCGLSQSHRYRLCSPLGDRAVLIHIRRNMTPL